MESKKLLKLSNLSQKYIFVLLPIITCIIYLIICSRNNLFPLGDKTIAWCDMNQQVIPLLNCFKDILEGKQNISYNLANAGGMSFFSVYFFFLSSPLSYLVIFVSKSNMVNFMNILVLFKLMIISGVISYYLTKKYKELNILINISLSLLYTYSIYTLMYYQNIMWLDIVYIFPLLMLSIDHLLDTNKLIPYFICITATVILNYYISYMVIIFVILYVSLNLIYRKDEAGIKEKAKTFVVASLLGALTCSVTIIPSFIEYLKSARGNSIIENLSYSYFITHLFTVLPLLFGTLSITPFLFSKKLTINKKIKYIMLLLLLIPMFIDPINCMWHLGSYQAFPCRFAFIVTFLIIDIVGCNLNEEKEEGFSLKSIVSALVSIILLVSLFIFEKNFISKRIEYLNQYATSLWGDKTSLEALFRYYMIIVFFALAIFLLFKLKLSNKKILGFSLIGLTICEVMFSTSVYLIPPSRDSKNYQELYSLKNHIDDDSFYRIKTNNKLTDVNVLNGAGFNTLGHYTSLTSEDYMFTMKKLGYSSYWMEVGQWGGTTFTDALLQNKYTLSYGYNPSSKFYSDHYYFTENKVLPFGLLTSSDLSKNTELDKTSRVDNQEFIYQSLFNDGSSMHTKYEPTSINNLDIQQNGNRTKYQTYSSGTLTYNIKITGKQNLYFEAFDKYSNSLSEAINEKISITSPRKTISSYPAQNNNGTIHLGEYENTNVTIKVTIKQSIEVSSLNLFSVNQNLLEKKIDTCNSTTLNVSSNKLSGTYYCEDENYLFIPISYSKNIKAKVNSKNVEVHKVFSSFVAIKLNKGENNITITFHQKGLGIGVILTLIGIACLLLYLVFKEKIKYELVNKLSYFGFIIISGVIFLLIYIFPVAINVIQQIK